MPSNLGMTIFEHMMQQAALEKQQEREDQLRRDQNQQLMNQKLQEALDYKLSREDKDFDRQLKIAELYGKLGSQEGRGAAPKMTSPRLQEMADVSYGLEQQRIPTEQREMEAVKLPIEMEQTNREGLRQRGRMDVENTKTARAREMENLRETRAERDRQNRKDIAQARIDLERAKFLYQKLRDKDLDPLKKKALEATVAKANANASGLLVSLLKEYNDRNSDASKASFGMMDDPQAKAMADYLAKLAAEGQANPEKLPEIYRELQSTFGDDADLISIIRGEHRPSTQANSGETPPAPGDE